MRKSDHVVATHTQHDETLEDVFARAAKSFKFYKDRGWHHMHMTCEPVAPGVVQLNVYADEFPEPTLDELKEYSKTLEANLAQAEESARIWQSKANEMISKVIDLEKKVQDWTNLANSHSEELIELRTRSLEFRDYQEQMEKGLKALSKFMDYVQNEGKDVEIECVTWSLFNLYDMTLHLENIQSVFAGESNE